MYILLVDSFDLRLYEKAKQQLLVVLVQYVFESEQYLTGHDVVIVDFGNPNFETI